MMGTIVDFEQLYLDAKRRICELELVIKSHGIPVKTFAGGEAHYALGSELESELAALRQQQSEPVAEIIGTSHNGHRVWSVRAFDGLWKFPKQEEYPWYVVVPVFAAPQIPEGWQLVPKEPNEEMYFSGKIAFDHGSSVLRVWAAMLAAAPEPKEYP